MNETGLMPILFDNDEFGSVRWLKLENEIHPFAVGNDIAKVLEYAKPTEAVTAHCPSAIRYGVTDSLGRMQETKIIPIGDVFRLITAASKQSKNLNIREKAERLESWIYDTVLPAIATTGTYSIQPVQQLVDPYKMNAEHQFQLEFLREKNRSKELDYKIEKVALEKMKLEANNKKAPEQSTVKNSTVQSFSLDEPLKVEKTIRSSDWKNLTEIVENQLKPYFPDVKKSRKLGANSLNDFLVENDYAERDFSELWSDGHYEDYTTIRFKEKGQELIQKGIVTYIKSSLKKNEDNVFFRTVYPKWHKTKAKDFFLAHQDEIKEFLAKPKKKSKKRA